MADNNTKLIIPIKFDLYFNNNFFKASINLSHIGLNINFIEQIKILALIRYFKEKVSLLGFSHGAWQSLLSSQFLKIDSLIYYDFLVNPLKFNLKRGFYKDFKFGFKTIFDYTKAFKNAKSRKIILMVSKNSPIYDKSFVNKTLKKIKNKNIKVNFFKDKHYISVSAVRKFLINEK